MDALTIHQGLVVPLDRANVDTDAIIPKQFLKSIQRAGYGPYLFDEWRYEDRGEPGMDCTHRPKRQDFVLNQPRYQGATVLLARENFGCGSSREHAPWALLDFGIRCVIALSFADIFYNNCFKNGILPVALDDAAMDQLFTACFSQQGFQLTVNLETQQVSTDSGLQFSFEVDAFRKHCLLHGLDDIGLTLQEVNHIHAYEARRKNEAPWLFQA
ncbi:MAG: 3-isopropylmalate dehydratase small subunit [Zetaproteobacteria bacterium]|nr:3-isopropylmalate dehydratase small subunit [Zetaproteobacteria bacterium]